jgi:hypothetical protein
MRKIVQFGCSLCNIFASLLHACLALYVEQMNERKLVCVCGAWKSCCEASLLPAPISIWGARIDRSAGLLAPTKSATQAKRQHVLFG